MNCAVRCLPTDMDKQELRAYLKQKRAEIPPEQKKKADRIIVETIAASSAFRRAETVLLYAPRGSEIDLIPLVRLARGGGKRVAFPRCDTETNTMRFFVLESDARLVKGAYGIFEPPLDAPLCETDESTLCILPGLSFDPEGGRLGYGKGYYDRFLADFKGVTLGAAYAALVAKKLPTEEHDVPVQILVTERGEMKCAQGKADSPTTQTKKTSPNFPILQKLAALVSSMRTKRHETGMALSVHGEDDGTDEPERQSAYPLHAPAILVAATFVLLLLSRLIDPLLTDRDNEYAVVVLLQLMIFLIPAVIYGKLRGDAFSRRIRMRLPRLEQVWFLVCMLAVMVSGGLLCGILTGGVKSLTGNFTLYSTFIARMGSSTIQTAYVILAYGVLPAFCEELVFRSILCAEYERFGVGVSIVASAIFFSMLHFSLPLFLSYLFLGGMLAAAMYATRSFFSAFALHLCYNLFCLLGQPYLSAFYVNAGSNEIFVFCLLVVFLLFAAFAAGEARKIYHRYARANVDSSYAPTVALRKLPKCLFHALLSPAAAVCFVIWLVMVIVNLV